MRWFKKKSKWTIEVFINGKRVIVAREMEMIHDIKEGYTIKIPGVIQQIEKDLGKI